MRPRGGFTIIELMIVIAILGIGAAMSVSSIITVLPKWRLQGSASDVLTQLQFARFEAVRRNRPVIVQFTNKGNASTSGMSICVDENRAYDGVCGSAGKTTLRTITIPTLYPKTYVSTVADAGGTAITSITFGPDGMVRDRPTAVTAPITVTMASTVATATSNYQAVVARSGIAKSAP